MVHQEVRTQVGTVPHKGVSGGCLGGVVGPDEIAGGVVVAEALLGALVQIQAHSGVDAVAVAHPGVVVAKEDQDIGLFLSGKEVAQLQKTAGGVLHRAKVVGHDVIGLRGIGRLQLRGKDIVGVPPDAGIGGVGTVALIGHREGEERSPCLTGLQVLDQVGEEESVGGGGGL